MNPLDLFTPGAFPPDLQEPELGDVEKEVRRNAALVSQFKTPQQLPEIVSAIQRMQATRAAHYQAAKVGQTALEQLVLVMKERTGQGYKLREMLFNLYNGRPADWSDILCLDYNLRQALCAVVLGWGYEDREVRFFYSYMQERLEAHGLFKWFADVKERPVL